MLGAHLTLFHVYSVPMPVNEFPVPVYNVDQLESDARKRLNQLKEKLLDRTGSTVIIHNEVKSGDVLTELKEYCSRVRPYAVVMGAESAGGFQRLLFGGKTLNAIRRLQWPLIIVPPTVRFRSIKKIGLACDMREVVESVRVQEIKELVDVFNAELHVLYVSEESSESYSAETVEESGLLQEMLGEMHPKYHFINNPVVEQGLIDFAEKRKLDLLVVIPKKHNLVDKLFQYGHSRQLVLHAHIPVMSIHE